MAINMYEGSCLDFFLCNGQPWWNSINHTTNCLSMGLSKGRDPDVRIISRKRYHMLERARVLEFNRALLKVIGIEKAGIILSLGITIQSHEKFFSWSSSVRHVNHCLGNWFEPLKRYIRLDAIHAFCSHIEALWPQHTSVSFKIALCKPVDDTSLALK